MTRLVLLLLLVPWLKTSAAQYCQCFNLTFSEDVMDGEIKTPRYPSRYCPNLNCQYNITAVAGMGVRFSIESFQTEANHDYLEISPMSQGMPFAVDRLSGSYGALSDIVTAEGDGLVIRFRSDGSVAAQGFRARWQRFNVSESECGCPPLITEVGAAPGTLRSPNHPRPYCHDIHCYAVLRTDPGYSVEVRIPLLELEPNNDFLVAKEGEATFAVRQRQPRGQRWDTALARWTGRRNDLRAQTRGHTMILEFIADGSASMSGFEATYRRVDSPCGCPRNVHEEERGTFTSPGFPQQYCDNINCKYQFRAAPGKVMKISFRSFALENNLDFLRAYDAAVTDGSDASKYLTGWTGTFRPPVRLNYTSQSRELGLRFTTDPSTIMQGFNATFEQVTRPTDCACRGTAQPNVITSESGVLENPGTGGYCGPIDCVAHIKPSRANMRLSVFIEKLNLRGPHDFITIASGILGQTRMTNHRTVSQLTGRSGRNMTLSSNPTTVGVSLSFHSEGSVTDADKGYRIRYRWVPMCQCPSIGRELTLEASTSPKTLTSPDYPSNYCDRLRCGWIIRAPPGHSVRVQFTDFRTESGHDFFQVYNGRHGSMMHRLSGYRPGRSLIPYTSPSNEFRVTFVTDSSVQFSGWSLTYASVPPATTQAPTTRRPARPTEAPATRPPPPQAAAKQSSSSGWSIMGPILFVVLLLVGAVLLYAFVLRQRYPVPFLDRLLPFGGGGSQGSGPSIGFVSDESFGHNRNYRPFGSSPDTQSTLSLVKETDD